MCCVCVVVVADSEGEGEMLAVKGGEGGRDEGMADLKKKMKELSAAHDMVVKNRCACVCACVCL